MRVRHKGCQKRAAWAQAKYARYPTGWLLLVAITSLTVASAIVYYPALRGFFVSDDFVLIAAVRDRGPLGVWTIGSAYFRPLISLSLFADYSVWGLNPIGYKLTNFSIHVLNSILVMLSVWLLPHRLTSGRRVTPAAGIVAGLVFALMPAHAEAVSWVSGRTDVICTMFALCSWSAFLSYSQRSRTGYLVASCAAFALALLSKEAAVTLPAVMALYLIYLRISRQETGRATWAVGANALVLLLYLALRFAAVGGLGEYGLYSHYNLEVRRWIAFPPSYLARTVWPCCWPSQALHRGSSLIDHRQSMWWFYSALGAVSIVSVAGVGAFQAAKRRETAWPVVLLLLASAIIAQLPSVTIGLQVETRIGERFVYLPSAFVASLMGVMLMVIAARPYRRLVIVLVVVLVYGASLRHANVLWYEAGEIARGIVGSMREIDASQPVAVIVPDHLRGAFVFRNGVQSAADLYDVGGDWFPVALVTLGATDDRFTLERENGEYRLAASQPGNAILPQFPFTEDIVVSEESGSARITLSDVDVAYYTQGGLQTPQ